MPETAKEKKMLEKLFMKEDGWESVEGCSVPKEVADDSYYAHTWARKNEDGSYSVFAKYKKEVYKKIFSAVRWRFEDSYKCHVSMGVSSETRANGLEDGVNSVFRKKADLPICKLRDFLQYE